jgi:hypothetical protein
MPVIKTIAGAAFAIGVLAFIAATMGGEPKTLEPVAAPNAAPAAEKPKAPPASTPDTEPGHKAPAAPPPKAVAPKAIAPIEAEPTKPKSTILKPTPVPVSEHTYADRDCGDFGSQAEAQRFFVTNGGPSVSEGSRLNFAPRCTGPGDLHPCNDHGSGAERSELPTSQLPGNLDARSCCSRT